MPLITLNYTNPTRNQKMVRYEQSNQIEHETRPQSNIIIRSPTWKPWNPFRKNDDDILPANRLDEKKHYKPQFTPGSINDEYENTKHTFRANGQSKYSEDANVRQFQQKCMSKTLHKLVSKKKLTKLNESDSRKDNSDTTDESTMRMYGDHVNSGINSTSDKNKETNLPLGNCIIKKTKVPESKLVELSSTESAFPKNKKVSSKSRQDLYSTLLTLQETNKILTDENEMYKLRLHEAHIKKMENVLLHQNIEKLKSEIGMLKNEVQLLRKEKANQMQFKDAIDVHLNRIVSKETVEWDTSYASISNGQNSKNKDKEPLKQEDKSISERLLVIEEAINDIVSILKIMNKMFAQQKRTSVRGETKSRKLDSQFDKLSLLQSLVNELVVVTNDTNLSEVSS